METFEIHISEIPRIVQCPGSLHLTKRLKEEQKLTSRDSVPARVGRATHQACGEYLLKGKMPQIARIALSHQCQSELDEILGLYYYFRSAWTNELREYFPDPYPPVMTRFVETETRTEIIDPECQINLVGTPDLYQIESSDKMKWIGILDLKTNRVKRDYYWQVLGYAYNVWKKHFYPDPCKINGAIVWIRLYGWEPYPPITTAELKLLEDTLLLIAKNPASKFNTGGDQCLYCPALNNCMAFKEDILGDMEFVIPETDLSVINFWKDRRDVIPAVFERMNILSKKIESIKYSLKKYFDTEDAILLPDGKTLLGLKMKNTKQYDPVKTFMVMANWLDLSAKQIAECLEIKSTNLQNMAKSTAREIIDTTGVTPRGYITAVTKELLDVLTQVHALSFKPSWTMGKHKIKDEDNDE